MRSCSNSATTCAGLRERHLPSLKIGMSQNTHGHGQPREVCIVVKRSSESTAGTSSGIDSTKSSGRLSRSGNGHWSRSRGSARFGLCRSVPSFSCQVTPVTVSGSSRRSSRSRISCSPSPRQTKSTSWHCGLTSCGVERREDAAERQLDVGIGRANLTGEHLGVGIARRREKAHADEVRLLPPHLVDDHFVGRVGVGLIEHRDLVAGALEHRRERHDADGREAHDLQASVLRRLFCRGMA